MEKQPRVTVGLLSFLCYAEGQATSLWKSQSFQPVFPALCFHCTNSISQITSFNWLQWEGSCKISLATHGWDAAASQNSLSVMNARSVMCIVQTKFTDFLLHWDTKLSTLEVAFLLKPCDYRYILTHYFHFSYVLVKRKKWLEKIISVALFL